MDENGFEVNPTIMKVRYEFYCDKRLQKLWKIGEQIRKKKRAVERLQQEQMNKVRSPMQKNNVPSSQQVDQAGVVREHGSGQLLPNMNPNRMRGQGSSQRVDRRTPHTSSMQVRNVDSSH